MSSRTENASVGKALEVSDAITKLVEHDVNESSGDLKLFDEAVRSLPLDALNDLLSLGVCSRCIIRLFGVHAPTHPSHTQRSILRNIDGERAEMEKCMVDVKQEFCIVCLGVLQFSYRDEKEMLVRRESANDLAVTVADLVKREGYQIDSFSLEVSIPPIITENDDTVWLYVERKYGSEPWFHERPFSGRISAKDALKLALTNCLETLLDVKCCQSSFRIRLTYSQAKSSKLVLKNIEKKERCKRRKIDPDKGMESVKVEHIISCASEKNAVTGNNSNGLQHIESSGTCIFKPEKVTEPCLLEPLCYRTSIYFGGRYLKFSRNVSQTRWIIDAERKGEASVEEIIGGNILPECRGDIYKFHAAGREDIDVRMLGSGRPFLVEIQNARQVPSELFVKEIEMKINNLKNKLLRVKNLKAVGSQGWDLMREGEAEKQKQYAALVWISRTLQDEDLQIISSLKEMKILQRTPVRVLHRRSPLDRERIIHWMKVEKIAGSSQYFLLHLCTQAGTYIKEFVHGDLGRTTPSIGSILGCRAEILQLDVTDVKMDCFLAE